MEQTAASEWSTKDPLSIIADLPLKDLQKDFLRSRWLAQVEWMDKRAQKSKRWYYTLHLTAVLGALIVPTLVGGGDVRLHGIGVVVSLLVAVCAAAEEFCRFGDNWRHYRRTVELLRIEGWHFLQLSGPYSDYETHEKAHKSFVAQVEKLNQLEAEKYIAEVAREQKKEQPQSSENNPS